MVFRDASFADAQFTEGHNVRLEKRLAYGRLAVRTAPIAPDTTAKAKDQRRQLATLMRCLKILWVTWIRSATMSTGGICSKGPRQQQRRLTAPSKP